MSKAEKLARELFSEDDLKAVSASIAEFESKTSGEIVISFQTTSQGRPYKTAQRIFKQAKLHLTQERNATLIVLFLAERKFAVYGDQGIHAKVPEGFWEDTIAEMRNEFASGNMKTGLLKGIQRLRENLAAYFPVAEDDVNELKDEILFGSER